MGEDEQQSERAQAPDSWGKVATTPQSEPAVTPAEPPVTTSAVSASQSEPAVPDSATLSPRPIVSKSKRSSRKLVLVIIGFLVLVAGFAAVYLWVLKKDPKPTAAQTTNTNRVETVATPPFDAKNQLYFQLGNTVTAYDTKTKAPTLITAAIPEDGKVLDLYSDGTTWRLYYSQQVSQTSKSVLYYLEKNQQAVKLVEATAFSGFLANAENQVAAYSEFADITTNQSATKTYIRADGKTTLLYESDPSGDADKGLKDARYAAVGISPDGKKLLFQRANCLNCDGGRSATSFELNIADKKTTAVYTATKSQGSVGYIPAGILLSETTTAPLGFTSDPYNETWLSTPTGGTAPKPLFSANESTWGYVVHDPGFAYVAVEKRAANYAETGASSFDALYERTGVTSKNLKKLTISGDAPTTDNMFSALSSVVNDCFTGLFNSRDAATTSKTYTIGIFCKTAVGLNYAKLGDQKYDSSQAGQPVATLLN